MKNRIVILIGAALGFLASLAGGWDSALTALIIFMVADYIAGIIIAGVFHKSKKTETGSLSSAAGLKGISKKVFMLIMVVVANQADILLHITYFRDAAIIALCTNELISLIEHANVVGIQVPVLSKAVEMLNKSQESTNP